MENRANYIKGKSVFISKKLEPGTPFDELKQQGITIIDEALIKLVQIPFSYTPQTKWIFFSSKNAIRYFFAQSSTLPDDVCFGVISESSAAYLKSFNKDADFVGSGTDLVKIGKDFAAVLKDDSVLFPQAMNSLRTIQKQLAFTNTRYDLYTYKTLISDDFDIPYTDIVIFTSPSNVAAYFTKYTISMSQIVIAMGSSTKYKLSEYGVKKVVMPDAFDDSGLYRILEKTVNGSR